jgi:threonyl-tRNA synthetase
VAAVNARGLRAQSDLRREKLGYKIREAERLKVPLILVVGDKEAEAGTAALRIHGQGDKGTVVLAEFLDKVKSLDDRRSLTIEY